MPLSELSIDDHFNPRSRKGSDDIDAALATQGIEFQSTLPQGERLLQYQKYMGQSSISIHAPARGATKP